LILNSGLNWTAASTITGGALNIAAGSVLNISGAGNHVLNNTAMNGDIVLNNATLDMAGGTLQLNAGTTLNGVGTVTGDVINNGGVVRPGGQNNVGMLTVLGDFTNNLGTLEIEIDGALTHDVLAVTNSLGYGNVAGSILDISLLAFIPTVAETHNVITCVTSCNTTTPFGTIVQPGGITHSFNYNANNLNLTVTSVSFFWDGLGDGSTWFDPLNWSLDVLPNAGIDVVLLGGDLVNFTGGSGIATISSLTLDAGSRLTQFGGTSLTILDSVTDLGVNAGASLIVNGGTLNNNGNAQIDGNFTQNSGNTTFANNLTLNGSFNMNGGIATVNGNAMLNGGFGIGNGDLTFNGNTSLTGPFNLAGGTMTIEAPTSLFNTNNTWSGGKIATSSAQTLLLEAGSTFVLSGGATKTLDAVTLDIDGNHVDVFGDGNLDLVNGAVILNQSGGGGMSFHHHGNGDIISTTGDGFFDNDSSPFVNVAGNTSVLVDFTNNDQVTNQAGTLSFNGNFQNFGTVTVNGGIVDVNGGPVGDNGIYNIGAAGGLRFGTDRNLNGTLASAGAVGVGNGVTLTLPAALTHNGAFVLNNAVLNLANLPGSTLQLANGAALEGSGNVLGNVANMSGVLRVGVNGTIGNLMISGSYGQGTGAAMVVEINNNGVSTNPDFLRVTGSTTIAGTLLIGYVNSSAGVVTSDFVPFDFQGGYTGVFDVVIDVGGNILPIDYGPVISLLGTVPRAPNEVINDILSLDPEKAEAAAEIRSEAEQIIEEIEQAEEEEEGEDSLLVCK